MVGALETTKLVAATAVIMGTGAGAAGLAGSMIAGVTERGGTARVTEISDAGHDVWRAAFVHGPLWDWLLAQVAAAPLAWRTRRAPSHAGAAATPAPRAAQRTASTMATTSSASTTHGPMRTCAAKPGRDRS